MPYQGRCRLGLVFFNQTIVRYHGAKAGTLLRTLKDRRMPNDSQTKAISFISCLGTPTDPHTTPINEGTPSAVILGSGCAPQISSQTVTISVFRRLITVMAVHVTS